jgi:hypothetical protein
VTAAAAEPVLAEGPRWEWSAAESLLLPLSEYTLVEQLLRGCRPPLLGKGGTIPAATLTAFRCGCTGMQSAGWRRTARLAHSCVLCLTALLTLPFSARVVCRVQGP